MDEKMLVKLVGRLPQPMTHGRDAQDGISRRLKQLWLYHSAWATDYGSRLCCMSEHKARQNDQV